MATRPRITVPRSYEDFQPPSNLLQEEDCETLIVNLPGFRKDQVKVQMEDRSGTLLLGGERPIGNNKWSRFRKELRVPINCNTNELQAKFENGVLRIIMPLKVVPKTAPTTSIQSPKIPDTTKPIPTPPPPPPPPSQKPLTQSNPRPKSQKPETPIPVWDPLLASQSSPSKKPTTGPKPLTSPLSPPSQKPITEPKPLPSPPSPPSQKLLTEPKPLPIPPSSARPESPRSVRLRPTPAPQHPLPDSKPTVPNDPLNQSPAQQLLDKTKVSESTHPSTGKPIPSQTIGVKSKSDIGQDETTGEKVGSADIVKKPIDLSTSKPENSGKQEKEKELKGPQEVKAHTKENVGHLVEDNKGRSERLPMEMDESDQYILNMVVALLVVVALWFYTKYTIKSLW